MQSPFPFIGLAYSVSGLLFAYNSTARGDGTTVWGYALTGIVCLVIGARFLGMPLNRYPLSAKTTKPDPLS